MAAPYNDEYTDRQKTRIYTPSSERTRYNQDDAIGQTQAIAPKERLFDGISVPQILAGAAAAAPARICGTEMPSKRRSLGAIACVWPMASSWL